MENKLSNLLSSLTHSICVCGIKWVFHKLSLSLNIEILYSTEFVFVLSKIEKSVTEKNLKRKKPIPFQFLHMIRADLLCNPPKNSFTNKGIILSFNFSHNFYHLTKNIFNKSLPSLFTPHGTIVIFSIFKIEIFTQAVDLNSKFNL